MARYSRIEGIDFWRGIILLSIFINHVPGNIFERFTHRNVGFSDASEAFVFLSGVSAALAYGLRFAHGDTERGTRALRRRAATLYAVQVALSLIAVAIFAAAAVVFDHDGLMATHGRDLVTSNPAQALFAMLGLTHQLGYFNILPLYVVLLLATPALLVLLGTDGRVMLIASATVYVLARVFALNLPTWPVAGGWFFNPFAWQFLYAIGLFIGLRLRTTGIAYDAALYWACVAILGLSALLITDGLGLWPGLWETWRGELDTGKTDLGLARLVHFLALAYVLFHSGVTRVLSGARPFFAKVSLIGQHGLAAFAAGSLLSAVGQIVVEVRPPDWLDDVAIVGLGVLAHYAVVRVLAARARPVGTAGR